MRSTPIPEPPFEPVAPARAPDAVHDIFRADSAEQYDMVELLAMGTVTTGPLPGGSLEVRIAVPDDDLI